jgi:hypothetical protein
MILFQIRRARNEMLKKTKSKIIIAISFVLIAYLVITYMSGNPKNIKNENSKEYVFEEELKTKNASIIEVIEKEHNDRSIFCTLTDQGVMVMELEPRDDSTWRKSFSAITGNSVLSDYLNSNGIYVDSVFLENTIFIYGVCSSDLNVRKIIITGPRGKTYECTLAKDNCLFFTKIDEESASGKTIQGLDDKGKVVVEDNHWVY